jgi:hypothetical protein
MDRFVTRLVRLEARHLAELPGLSDTESAALIERVRTAIQQGWEGMTEQERYEAEHLSQPEMAQRLAELRAQLEERAETSAVGGYGGRREGLRV